MRINRNNDYYRFYFSFVPLNSHISDAMFLCDTKCSAVAPSFANLALNILKLPFSVTVECGLGFDLCLQSELLPNLFVGCCVAIIAFSLV